MRTHTDTPDSFSCPNCGEEVPAGAPCCPECGADENTGWSPDTMYDDLDLPDADEQDDDVNADSPSESAPALGSLPGVIVAVIAALLIAAFLKWMW